MIEENSDSDYQRRIKTSKEADYNLICENDGDRYPFIKEMMQTTVTDKMKAVAKSYHKKSKSFRLVHF